MFNLELKLSKISMITLAKTFWDHAEIIIQIERFFSNGMQRGKDDWYKYVAKNVLHLISALGEIPLRIKTQLEEVIVYVGDELHSWYQFLLKNLELEFSYAKVIYLSPFGTIDESKIFRKYWLENRSLFENAKENAKYNFFDLPCMFCEKESIYILRYEIIDNMKKIFSRLSSKDEAGKLILKMKIRLDELESQDDIITVVLTHWLNAHYRSMYFDIDKKLKVIESIYLPFCDVSSSIANHIESEMLQISIDAGNPHAFKYFLNKLSVAYRDHISEDVIFQCKKKFRNKTSITPYERKKYFEIMLILQDGVSLLSQEKVMSDYYETFLKMMLYCWPYQELFLELFGTAFSLNIISGFQWKKILWSIMKSEKSYHNTGCPIQRSTHRLIFQEIWGQTSREIQQNYWFSNRLTKEYFDMLNFPMLKIMINFNSFDEESRNFSVVFDYVYDWIIKDELHKLEKFLKEMLEEDELERFEKEFKKSIVERLIREGNHSALEKLIVWLDKFGINIIKSDIDGLQAFSALVKYGKCHKTDEFLKWLYQDHEEKIVQVTNYCKTEEFSKNCIFEIFSTPDWRGKTPKELSSRFLKYVYTTKEEIKSYKLNLLKDEISVLNFALICDKECFKRRANSNFFPIRELILFCELPNEKVEELKTKCLERVEIIMNLYTTKCKCYIVADHLINWLVKNNGRRQRIIKKIMKSGDGLIMCNKILNLEANLDSKMKEIVLRFYNKWVRSCKNIPELLKGLEDINEGRLTEADKTKLSNMFSKLEKGNNLEFSELLCYAKESFLNSDDEYDTIYDSYDSFFTLSESDDNHLSFDYDYSSDEYLGSWYTYSDHEYNDEFSDSS